MLPKNWIAFVFLLCGTVTLQVAYAQPEAEKKPVEGEKGEPPALNFNALSNLIGRHHFGKEVRDFRRDMQKRPHIWYSDFELTIHHTWQEFGISMVIDHQGLVKEILLERDKSGEWKGELPGKITFSDDAEMVIAKLGEPDERFEQGEISEELCLTFKRFGATVRLDPPDENPLGKRHVKLVVLKSRVAPETK